MSTPQKFAGVVMLIAVMVVAIAAQRPRSMSTDNDKKGTPKPAAAPQTVKAKYEGGVFGYRKAMEGTLNFDDANRRLVFKNEQQKDVFFIPYDAVSSAFADSQKRRPAAATAASNVPYIGFPIGLIKTKVSYLTIQYSDQDSRVSAVASFRLDTKELVASMLAALADKSGLTPRGDIYVRKKDSDSK